LPAEEAKVKQLFSSRCVLHVILNDPQSKQWQILSCVLYVAHDLRAAEQKEVEGKDPPDKWVVKYTYAFIEYVT